MKLNIDDIRIVGVTRVRLGHVDSIVRCFHRRKPLEPIIIDCNHELLEGADVLHAARRVKLDEVDVIVQERP